MLEQAASRLRSGRIDGLAVLVDVLDHTVLVNHEGGAVGEIVLLVQNAVVFGDGAFEVAEERKLEAVLLREDVIRG